MHILTTNYYIYRYHTHSNYRNQEVKHEVVFKDHGYKVVKKSLYMIYYILKLKPVNSSDHSNEATIKPTRK